MFNPTPAPQETNKQEHQLGRVKETEGRPQKQPEAAARWKRTDVGVAGLWAARIPIGESICPSAKKGVCAEDKNHTAFKCFH